jgi:hypothetical protein
MKKVTIDCDERVEVKLLKPLVDSGFKLTFNGHGKGYINYNRDDLNIKLDNSVSINP